MVVVVAEFGSPMMMTQTAYYHRVACVWLMCAYMVAIRVNLESESEKLCCDLCRAVLVHGHALLLSMAQRLKPIRIVSIVN